MLSWQKCRKGLVAKFLNEKKKTKLLRFRPRPPPAPPSGCHNAYHLAMLWLAYCVIFPSMFLAFNCNLLAFRCLLPIHGWQQQKRKKNATSKAKTSKKPWRYKQNTFILSAFKLFSFIRFFFSFLFFS